MLPFLHLFVCSSFHPFQNPLGISYIHLQLPLLDLLVRMKVSQKSTVALIKFEKSSCCILTFCSLALVHIQFVFSSSGSIISDWWYFLECLWEKDSGNFFLLLSSLPNLTSYGIFSTCPLVTHLWAHFFVAEATFRSAWIEMISSHVNYWSFDLWCMEQSRGHFPEIQRYLRLECKCVARWRWFFSISICCISKRHFVLQTNFHCSKNCVHSLEAPFVSH